MKRNSTPLRRFGQNQKWLWWIEALGRFMSATDSIDTAYTAMWQSCDLKLSLDIKCFNWINGGSIKIYELCWYAIPNGCLPRWESRGVRKIIVVLKNKIGIKANLFVIQLVWPPFCCHRIHSITKLPSSSFEPPLLHLSPSAKIYVRYDENISLCGDSEFIYKKKNRHLKWSLLTFSLSHFFALANQKEKSQQVHHLGQLFADQSRRNSVRQASHSIIIDDKRLSSHSSRVWTELDGFVGMMGTGCISYFHCPLPSLSFSFEWSQLLWPKWFWSHLCAWNGYFLLYRLHSKTYISGKT